MSWAAWGPTIVSIITAVFMAGLIAGRIRHQESTLVEHRAWLLAHDVDLKDHSARLSRAEAWREGYAAGSNQK